MSEGSAKEGIITKIVVGVSVALIPTLVLYYLGVDKKSDPPKPDVKIVESGKPEPIPSSTAMAVTEADYREFLGIYRGKSKNTTGNMEGNTILIIKEIDNTTKKVKIEVQWSDGLYGYGRLNGIVSGNRIEVAGQVMTTEFKSDWDIEMKINLKPNSTSMDGTYQFLPVAGNPYGVQNGIFDLKKD